MTPAEAVLHELRLAAVPGSVATARAAIAKLGLPDPPQRSASLLTSELVTNAVVHTDADQGDPITLRTMRRDDQVRIEVLDGGTGFKPATRDRPSYEPGGWGLVLVDELADRWGVEREVDHTCVWCEFAIVA
ncbi:MAG: ATP-binding protein [Thermoleophilaceae bacterium]